jgi:RNA polymerase sigma-70 factor (ECF subfamily)
MAALIPQLRAVARSLCRDRAQAEDLAQAALASAWRNRRDFAPGTNLKAWVFRILRNQFYSDYRRSWRMSQLDSAVAEQTLVAVSNPIAALELDDVRRAMLALPDAQREALTLIGVAGLSYEEAAKICGCAIGTVKSRVGRARQRLLAVLSGRGLQARSYVAGGVMASMLADAERLSARGAETVRPADELSLRQPKQTLNYGPAPLVAEAGRLGPHISLREHST